MTDRNGAGKLATLLTHTHDAIIDANLEGVITSWNPAAEALFGFTREEAIGKSIMLISPEDRTDEAAANLAHAKAGETTESYESVRIRKDGTKVPISLSISPVYDAQGPIIGACAIATDLTDRKMAEQSLRRIAAIVESSNDMIIDMTLEGIITSWNPAAERLYGLSRQEAIGKSGLFIEPSDRAEEIVRMLATVAADQPAEPYETMRVREDGSEIFLSFVMSPVKDCDGVVIGVSGIGRDLTDRHLAEQELGQINAIVEHSHEGIAIATPEGVITTWNPAAERMFGLSSEDVIGKSLLAISPRDRADEIADLLAQVRAGQTTEPYERVRVRPDGTQVFLSLTISPVKDADGVIFGVSAIIRDLTGRHTDEQEIRRFAALVEHSNDAIVETTLEGVIVTWNPAAERMFGASSQQAIGASIMNIEPTDRAGEIAGLLAKVRAGQPAGPYESVRTRQDGTKAEVSLSISPVKDAEGTIIAVSAIGRDVTREKQALREIADWRDKAFKWMEKLERTQQLGVMQEFERELKVIDLQQQIEDLKRPDPPRESDPEDGQ